MAGVGAVLKNAASGFVTDQCPSRGASIAYYAIFSLAPLLVIAVAIAGAAFGEEAARGALADQIRNYVGEAPAAAIQGMIANASSVGHGTIGAVLGVGALLLGASGVFGEVQSALNAVWHVNLQADTGSGPARSVSRFVLAKAIAFALVLGTGALLLASVVASAVLAGLGEWLSQTMPALNIVVRVLNILLPLVLSAVLFGTLFKYLPERPIAWRDALIGGAVTAVLFAVGRHLIGWYLGSSAMASVFGAAASLALLLVWIYYSAQILLFGAEFTRAWAERDAAQEASAVAAIDRQAPPARPRRRPAPSLAQLAALAAWVVWSRRQNHRH